MILLYLMLYVFSIGLVILGEEFYMCIYYVYDLGIFCVGLIVVVVGVVYYVFNGLCIIVMDFVGVGVVY